MRVFIIGVSGYIGGTVADRLLKAGHTVSGLARSPGKAAQLEERGITPVRGSMTDLSVIQQAARDADAVINAANSDEASVVRALCTAMENSGKALLHTSGTSVAADAAMGEAGAGIRFTEDMPLPTLPERLMRVAIEQHVLTACGHGVRGIVIRPALIYGRGTGLNPYSHQVPTLAGLARERGRPVHVGRGLAAWSNVHIDDVADLFVRALDASPAGHVYFAADGDCTWRDLAVHIGQALGQSGGPESLPLAEALERLGAAAVTSFSSNSLVSSDKARMMLGWSPAGPSLTDQLASDPAWPEPMS
jgi:nucleoside-diphosphate-sugar epimerase